MAGPIKSKPPVAHTDSDKKSKHSDSDNESRLAATRALIRELHKIDTEVIVPSEGPPQVLQRDPHLRLRRTLTPPSKYQGCSPEEAQFLITDSTGERVSLSFSCFGKDFIVDGYFWGASEEKATKRVIAVHGGTPGISRTCWHAMGEMFAADPKFRFCAIDWHSLDRTDKPQDEFLTMLPKHFFDMPPNDVVEKMLENVPKENFDWMCKVLQDINAQCPRSFNEGAEVLRAIIQQGCGWGVPGKPFALCVKSWSGGIGMEMLLEAALKGGEFRNNIAGAVIMHPGYFNTEGVNVALAGLPTKMCWARDDPKVSFTLFSPFYVEAGADIHIMETGGHANFPEFHPIAAEFLRDLSF